MQLLASAITHCRFEASDSAADEIVLLRILKLMEGIISGPGGEILGDESVCEMMETGLSMCCQVRLSELLRRSAEISMVSMCQVIFERLKHLEIEVGDDPGALDEQAKDDMDAVKMDPSSVNGSGGATTANLNVPGSKPGDGRRSPSLEKGGAETAMDKDHAVNSSQIDLSQQAQQDGEEEPPEVKPYSLPSIRELFRVLVHLLDPYDRNHTDTMRVMALRIVDVALEVAGPSIANHPSLASLAKDTLCRHLFQLVRSENMAILNESLRVAGTLLATCRPVLKLQQELFLSYLVACLFPRVDIPPEPGIDPALYEGVPQSPSLVKPAPTPPQQQQPSSGRSTPVPVKDRQRLGLEGGSRKPDAREAMVESVGALVRIPSFMVELFVNYDCEIDRSDLCMDMVGLLSRNAFPDSATWSTTNVPPLCLDALLTYVQFIAGRLDDDPVTEGFPDLKELREQRTRKKVIIRGATRFNENPKGGIAFLATQGIIEDPDDPNSIARFLKGTTRIDKKILGEFLSKKSNGEILSAFLDLFDFADQRVDEALRQLLNSFRLPGESQLIERIVTEFSEKYCAKATPDGIADKDAVYVLTYAIIMLNTDQHNPNLKNQKRMSYEDFARNLRGVNGGKDFEPEYLQQIYDSIKTREIILPEEHDNRHAYDHAWKELQVRVQSTADLLVCDTNIFDADMFAATWKPIVATLSYVFMSASDDTVFARVVTGFYQCAEIASSYGLSDALDHIVFCLGQISTLASDSPPSTALNTEVQVEKKSVMVSEMAVKFGRDDRAQLATVVLFRVINGSEGVIRDGWSLIVRIILNLFVNSLVPTSFSSSPNTIDLPPIPLQNPVQVIDRASRPPDAGLFSAFTSYVSSFANDEPPEPSDQEVENTLCTVDCIAACAIDDVFENISQLPVDCLRSLVLALLAQVPEDTSPRVIVVKPDLPNPTPVRPNGGGAGKSRQHSGPVYDPSLPFVLELATLLALRDKETVAALGKDVADALQTVVRDAQGTHPEAIARAVYYLLTLLRASSSDHDFIRAPILLHTFSTFDDDLLRQHAATPLLRGLIKCVKAPCTGLRSELANSPDFWQILHQLHGVPDAAADVFALVEELAAPNGGEVGVGISADNYEAAIALLNEFATAGSAGAADEQRRDREQHAAGRRGKRDSDRGVAGPGAGAKGRKSETSDVVARGVKAVAIIYQLTARIPHFIEQSQLETNEAWTAYWSPIFRALTTQCLNPCREIRFQAMNWLQRTLLSAELASPEHKEWTAIFGEVLFPLIGQLLKPDVYRTDPVGMGETRVQAATLLCKIFLHYLVALSEWEGLLDLWVRILGIMDRLMNSGQGDNLEEAVPESLKNILLVMSSGGQLVPPAADTDDARRALWAETWRRLDRFLPGLFAELFPEEAKRPMAPPPGAAGPAQERMGKRNEEGGERMGVEKKGGDGEGGKAEK
ncbi:cytohesin-2 [Lineolata rhizophorae]|uniref:Cytohesin-2 n=1 Tax=Lineolata rhizophorae TaxID=578093 RepID=A0A6A6P5Q6_9PEZI|nr:cytohesin-2 [Lineolata rhizophorae]